MTQRLDEAMSESMASVEELAEKVRSYLPYPDEPWKQEVADALAELVRLAEETRRAEVREATASPKCK